MRLNNSLYSPLLPIQVIDTIKQLNKDAAITEVTISVIAATLLKRFHPELTTDKTTQKTLKQRVILAIHHLERTNHIQIQTKLTAKKTAYMVIIPNQKLL